MKAVYISDFGADGNLAFREVPDPRKPSIGEVLVRVRAAGLNRADLLQRRGGYPPPAGFSPNIPGLEVAGEVIDAGSGVKNVKIGDRVFGIVAGEGQAEMVTVSAEHLACIPENLDFVQAAAVPEAFITAYDAVFTRGLLAAGETMLVHAVGSGVGLAALQLAKTCGVVVIGTSRSPGKLEAARAFGLDHGILMDRDVRFHEQVLAASNDHGADVILDLVGAAYLEENLHSLAIKGRLLLVGLPSGRKATLDMGMVLQRRATIIGTVLRTRTNEEKAAVTRVFSENVLPLLRDGRVVPILDKVYPAADAATAYSKLESDSTFGKIVLEF